MKENRWIEVVGAILLILAGALALAQTTGLLPTLNLSGLPWGLALAAGGLVFVAAHFLSRAHWWTLIAGAGLLGPGLTIVSIALGAPGELAAALIFVALALAFLGVYRVGPRQNWWALLPAGVLGIMALVVLASGVGSGELAGAILFLGLGAIFVALYFVEIGGKRQNWWALIPAGALWSLALVIIASFLGLGAVAGAVLFLGLGATFGVLYLLRGPGRPLQWAWIPALALVAFGAFILLVGSGSNLGRVILALLVIAVGVAILLRQGLRPSR